jgi:hypothetical protein
MIEARLSDFNRQITVKLEDQNESFSNKIEDFKTKLVLFYFQFFRLLVMSLLVQGKEVR